MDEKCENCKFFEPTDAKSGEWDGTCTNKTIPRDTHWLPFESWPYVRRISTCGLFEQGSNAVPDQPIGIAAQTRPPEVI
jgi:hypothetical protein